jgi:hypothetical protein
LLLQRLHKTVWLTERTGVEEMIKCLLRLGMTILHDRVHAGNQGV